MRTIRSQVSAVGKLGTISSFWAGPVSGFAQPGIDLILLRRSQRGRRERSLDARLVATCWDSITPPVAVTVISMQLRVNAFCERMGNAGHARQIFDARGLNSLQAAKMREERLPALRSDSADLLQCRRV